nr:hypothetical protein GCM10020092_042140 [Actinoplanes digitatis]
MRLGAHQAGEADDLAAAHHEVLVLADLAVGGDRVPHVPVADLEEDLADRRRVVREPAAQLAADHAAHDAVLVDAVRLDVQRLDRLAVAQDGDLVGDRLDLVQLVRDHDRGDAALAEAAQQVEQVPGVGLVQRGGRLVQDEQPDVLGERLGDLHELLLADADVLDQGVGVLLEADPRHQVQRHPVGGLPVDRAALAGLVAEEDVLGDRHVRDEGELLVDDHDARVLTGPNVVKAGLCPLVNDVTVV